MNVVWRKAAQADLDGIFDYIIESNPQAALRLYETIRSRVERLADHPALGRAGRVPDTRELVIPGTPYLVAYTVDRRIDAVVILRVLHGRQNWPEEFEDAE
jgi:toxin ParE1/3/4